MPGARRRGRPRTAWMATSRRGQDSPCKSQSEWQRTEINGESTSKVWPTLVDRGRLKNRTADGTEAAAVDHYFPSSTENVSFEPCLRTPGNRLTIVLWRALVPNTCDSVTVTAGSLCASICVCAFPCSKRQTAWSVNTKTRQRYSDDWWFHDMWSGDIMLRGHLCC